MARYAATGTHGLSNIDSNLNRGNSLLFCLWNGGCHLNRGRNPIAEDSHGVRARRSRIGMRKARAIISNRREALNRFVPRLVLLEKNSSSLQQENPTSAFQRGRFGPQEDLPFPGRSTRKIRP